MSRPDSTHSIPTLTQRVDPPPGVTPPTQDDLPVLTERIQDAPARDHAPPGGSFAQGHTGTPAHQASGLEHPYDAPHGHASEAAHPSSVAPWETEPDMSPTAQTGFPQSAPAAIIQTFPTEQAPSAVLRAALQAELEHAVHNAIEEAVTGIYARLDAELPTIIDRALQRVKSG